MPGKTGARKEPELNCFFDVHIDNVKSASFTKCSGLKWETDTFELQEGGLNESVHNTQWVTGHFHLIFGGPIVIMYFMIAYELWPQLTQSPPLSARLVKAQLWSWFIGMLVLSAYQILVLRRGRIVERGTHEELLAKAGEYAALWRRQTRAG